MRAFRRRTTCAPATVIRPLPVAAGFMASLSFGLASDRNFDLGQ